MGKKNENSRSKEEFSQSITPLSAKNKSQLPNSNWDQPFYLHHSPYGAPSNLADLNICKQSRQMEKITNNYDSQSHQIGNLDIDHRIVEDHPPSSFTTTPSIRISSSISNNNSNNSTLHKCSIIEDYYKLKSTSNSITRLYQQRLK